jgi:predicted nucleic acid-binding protein
MHTEYEQEQIDVQQRKEREIRALLTLYSEAAIHELQQQLKTAKSQKKIRRIQRRIVELESGSALHGLTNG